MSRLETALATLATNLAALTDCTVVRNYDLAVPWETLTTGRFVNLHDGTWVPRSRNGQTIWLMAPVLELHVKGTLHSDLGPRLVTLHADVMTVLAADPKLGGVAAWCEPSEDEPATSAPADGDGGPAASITMPLSIAVATAPNDLTIASAAA